MLLGHAPSTGKVSVLGEKGVLCVCVCVHVWGTQLYAYTPGCRKPLRLPQRHQEPRMRTWSSGQGETSQIKNKDFLNAITHLIPADKVPALTRQCAAS